MTFLECIEPELALKCCFQRLAPPLYDLHPVLTAVIVRTLFILERVSRATPTCHKKALLACES